MPGEWRQIDRLVDPGPPAATVESLGQGAAGRVVGGVKALHVLGRQRLPHLPAVRGDSDVGEVIAALDVGVDAIGQCRLIHVAQVHDDLRLARSNNALGGGNHFLIATCIQVPRQFVTSTVEDAAALLARNSKNDQPSVIKSEFGVGGFGARTILPHEIGSEADALDTWRALANEDNIFGNRMLIVEDYIRGRSVKRDLTVDLVVDQEVEIKCVGEMLVEGTKYGGVNIGPHAVPEVEATAMREFGVLVGEAIMAIGYRGWFDIDFVAGRDGVLFPTEINARRTGPTIAHSIRERLRHTRPGRDYRVRTLDLLPLNRPIPEDELYAKLKDMTVVLRETCAVDMLPTLFTASEDDAPYFGVALIESVTPESALPFGALDDAESVLRSSALAF